MTIPDIIMTDDEMQRMPRTRHLMKADELQRWVASGRWRTNPCA
jgi:hypothetical protein